MATPVATPVHHIGSDATRSALHLKLDALRIEGALCDIEICAGQRRFPAHRVVLAAGSDFFRVLLSTPVGDSLVAEQTLHEISADVLEHCLEFFYRGVCAR